MAVEQSDHPLLNGVAEIVVNYDLDVATGNGKTWGTWVNESDTVDGRWVGAYRGTFVGFALQNRSIATGTGELSDYLWIGSLEGATAIPDPPPCDAPQGAETWHVLLIEK